MPSRWPSPSACLTSPSQADAANPTDAKTVVDLGNSGSASYDSNHNLNIGNQVRTEGEKQQGQHNTAIGTNTDTLRNVTKGDKTTSGQPMDTDDNKKLVDGEGQAHNIDDYKSTEAGGSTAVGYNNHNEGDRSTTIGNTAKITNKPVTYYVDADGNKTASKDQAVWYKDATGKPTKVPQVFRDADGNTTTTAQYVHTYTEKDPTTGEEVTKTEITSDATKADQKDGQPVYNYQKSDNLDKLYTVTLYQSSSNSIAAGTDVIANGSNAVAVGYSSIADNSAVAIGDTAQAEENAVAIGKSTKATADGSIALGMDSQADRSGGTIGWDPKTGTTSTSSDLAWKSTEGALSIGNGSASRQITGVAAGSEDTDAVNLAQLKNAMTHYYSVKTTEATDAAGNNNYLNDGATGNNALAAGVSAVAKGDNATAVGTNTYASGEDASAYGYRAAAMGEDSVSIGSGTSAQQEGSVAIGGHAQGYYAVQVGSGSTAQSAYSVAVGGHAKGDHSVEVGYGSTAQGSYSTSVGGHAIGNYSIAIGSSKDNWGYINAASAAGDNSIAIGGHTNSANNIAIGSGSATSGQYAITVGGHATSNQAVSIGGVATNSQAIAVGYGSSSTGSQSTAVGGHAGDTNSTAVGQGANANYAYATAVGNSSVASGDHSTALGYGTSVQGSSSTAIGGASAKGSNVTAIGKNSTVGGDWSDFISDSTVIGGAHISASDAAAIGSNATVNGQYGVALGYNSNVSYASTGVGSGTKASNTGTAVGYGAQSSGYQSAAVGAGSNATGQNAVALGGGGAWGNYSIALGSGAGTTAHGIAIGQNSGAWGESAIAIGEGSNAWRANSIVLGKNSKSGADKNIEGYDPHTGVASVDDTSTWQSTDEAVSIGRAEERDGDGNITATAITRQLNNLAAGTLDTDAVNVAQLKAATQKVNVHDYSVWSPNTETDTNYTNEGAVAKNSMAAGVSASTTKDAENAVAIGYKAKAEGYGTTVIGQYASATGRYALAFGGQQTDTTAEQANNMASGDNAVSFGERTTASGANATAFGEWTVASGESATAFGSDSTASGKNSLAFGENSTAAAENSLAALGGTVDETATNAAAIGSGAQAKLADSIALGNGSVADRASGAKGYDMLTKGDTTNTSAAWVSNANAIAVGNDTDGSLLTRQITGVAAGSLDTDAVNVAQLKAAGLSFTTNTKDASNTTDNYKGYKVVSRRLGDTIAIKASDEADNHSYSTANLTTRIAENGDISILMDEKPTFTSVTTGDVIFAGNPDLTDKDGKAAKADTNVHYGTKTLTDSQNITSAGNDTQATRLHYKDDQGHTYEVATMDDGQTYAGDVQDSNAKANAFSRKLNEQTNVVGGVTNLDDLSKENNVGVVSNGTDTLTIRLAKKLTDLTSVTTVTTDAKGNKTSETVQNGNGITITPSTLGAGKSAVSLTDKGLSNGGNQITHVDSGLKDAAGNKVELKDATGDVLNNAVNVGDLKNVQNAVTSAHTAVTVNGGVGAPDAGANGAFGDYTKEDKGNLLLAQKKDTNTNQITYDLKLNDKVALGKAGTNGKDGVDGSIGLTGADGKSSVGLNGKDGISVIGKDGKNGVSITGSNGLNGKNGIDGKIVIGTPDKDGQPGKDAVSISGKDGVGHIGLTGPKGEKGADGTPGKDGISIDITTDLKSATLDDKKNVSTTIKDAASGKETTIEQAPRIQYKNGNNTYEVATMDDGQKYAGDFGKGASVKLNKTVNVQGNAKKEADLTDGNIGVVSSQSGDDGQLLIKLNKDLNLGNNGSVKMGNTTINNDGMTISKTESGKTTTVTLTDKGLNNGGNKITNVAAGTDGTDAVNVSQLNDVKHLAEQHTTVEAGPSGNVKVTSGTNADGSKKYTVDLAKDVTFGNAGNGDKTVAISGTDGTVTAGTGDNKVTVDGSKGQIVAGGDNGVKIGKIADGDGSLTIYDKDGKAMGKTDKAGKYVTNLDNKNWNKDGSYVSGRAATEDQLHQVESNVNKQIDDVNTKIDTVDKHHTEVTVNGGTAAKADGSYTDGNLQIAQKTGADGQKVYDLKLNDNLNIGGVGKDGKDGKDGHVGINGKDGKSGVGIDGKDGISVKGKDGQNGVTIKGVDGKDGTEGHIGLVGPKGPKGADGKDGQNASADIHVKNGQVGVDGTDGHGGKDGMDRVVYEDHNGTSHEVATMDDGMKYSGDSGNAAVKLNNNVQLYGGAKEYAAGDNIGVVVSQDGDNAKMQVKLAKDLKGIDSIDAKTVTTGNTTINNSGMTVKGDDKHKDITVQQGNVNMGGNKIEGVAPGKVTPDSTEAVNGSQLAQRDQAIGKLGGEVSSLDRRVDRVGAGAAALAALHPQDFDPDDKWDFAVGYGNYRGANAAAVGAFYRPNEDTTLSVGGTVGGGENMVNAGISFKFGQGNHVTNSRVAMAKEILALKDYVQKQDEEIEKLEALVGQQGTAAAPKRRSILFPDVPENHWAYVYVKKLADRGLLEGYPDGEFKGDRTITRYEFAAIFSRALENGASVDNDMERMSEEFEPEIRELSLNRFRVDRVEGKDNDRHKIERVRVNDRDELVKQKNGEQKKRYRDVYGSVIEKDAPADAAK